MNGTVVSEFVSKNFFYVFLALVAVTIYERRLGEESSNKRIATLIQAIAVFLVVVAASGVLEFGWTDLYLYAAVLAIGIVLATVARKKAFPYRRTCPSCNTALDYKTILFRDDHLCPTCRPGAQNSGASGPPEARDNQAPGNAGE